MNLGTFQLLNENIYFCIGKTTYAPWACKMTTSWLFIFIYLLYDMQGTLEGFPLSANQTVVFRGMTSDIWEALFLGWGKPLSFSKPKENSEMINVDFANWSMLNHLQVFAYRILEFVCCCMGILHSPNLRKLATQFSQMSRPIRILRWWEWPAETQACISSSEVEPSRKRPMWRY